MKTVIIGGVAAGTKAAAKLKRERPQDEVVIYTAGQQISYAGCGLPYYLSGMIETEEELVVNTPEKFSALTGAEVHTGCEAVRVAPEEKAVTLASGEKVSYDRLILAVGARSLVPKAEGVELPGVFTLRTPKDAVELRAYADTHNCRKAVIVGGGFIGLETAENLQKKGLSVTVMDFAPQILPNLFDRDMADYLRRELQKRGVRILTGTAFQAVKGETQAEAVVTSAGNLPADLVILAMGIRPATEFLEGSGIIRERGLIVTDEYHHTNLKNIYAVGDCARVHNRITGQPQWSAMGSTANIAARNLALGLCGEERPYPGCLGTGVAKLSEDLNAARTGLTAAQAQDAESVVCIVDDKAHYYEDASTFVIKLVADRESHKLLGLQAAGSGSVDKLADIAVAGISLGAKLEDFVTMDFSYAPPFSTAIHPLATACGILLNKLDGKFRTFTPEEYAAGAAENWKVVDAQPAPSIPGAPWMDLKDPEAAGLSKGEKLLLVCAKGKRGYLLQRKLAALGSENVKVLEGGKIFNVLRSVIPAGAKLPPEEIKRVKGLGCLQDKRYPDIFNVRVITRNGRITTDEQRCMAEAADRFGSGMVTITTRQTVEIQGVPYAKIDELLAFLAENGLETGGTGSLVRPIVSCKGTTCQYGLIDTYDLSEKLHKRFYQGYHKVTLPHKFKIAVGGCPNNCVKPDLNDLGIIGQRRPLFDFSKCRGCKVCQVEKICPIHTAQIQDGKLHVEDADCNRCGRCVGKCPFGVTAEYENGYKIYIGGRWGKRYAHGRPLDKFFTSEEEVLDTVERAILFFRNEGLTGERFADTVTRLGFEYVQDKLLHEEIRKDEILKKKVKGGATC